MPRVHHVKKARKDNPVCKAGESYYWWKFNYGPKRYSLTPPKRSQLTRSEFLSQMYDIEDAIAAVGGRDDGSYDVDDLTMKIEDLTEQIRTLGEECQEKLDNMPEQLQYAPTGEMLQSRIDECDSMASELEAVDLMEPEDEKGSEKYNEWLWEKADEISQVCYNGE